MHPHTNSKTANIKEQSSLKSRSFSRLEVCGFRAEKYDANFRDRKPHKLSHSIMKGMSIKMKKKSKLTLIMLLAIFTVALSVTCALGAFASEDPKTYDPAADASPAPGGEVRTTEQLIAALGGENNVIEASTSGVIRLKKNIRLEASIIIYTGNYRIIGNGCTIYRGFNAGEMFHLVGASFETSSPSLTLGSGSFSQDELLEENADLIISGNRNAFTEPANGPIFALSGQVSLTVNHGTMLIDNYTSAPGGAIYMESLAYGTEYTPLEPTLNVTGGQISGNTSTENGGAIALLGDVNGNGSGLINISSCVISGNSVANSDGIGKGGAIYSNGGGVILTSCTVSSNEADLGGAIYTDHETIITSCSLTLNKAKTSGGVIYGAQAYDRDTNATTHASLITLITVYMTENTSLGDGGAITNYGELKLPKDNASYICQNTSSGDGAAIYNAGTVTIDDGDFFYNKSSGGRGAIFNTGKVTNTGGEIRVNTTLSGSAVYNLGTFELNGGYIQSNICTVKNAPQIVNFGTFVVQGSFVIEDDVVGLMVTYDKDDQRTAACIELMNNITTNIKINVAFFTEHTDDNGELSYSVENASKMTVFTGSAKFKSSAIERTNVVSKGFGRYVINENGALNFRFPVMPLFAWILCFVALAACIYVAIRFTKRRKTLKTATVSSIEKPTDEETTEK